MKQLFSILIICVLSFSLWGNDEAIDEDALFGGSGDDTSFEDDLFEDESDLFGGEGDLFGGDLVTEIQADEEYAPEDDLLVSEGITWGGSISTSIKATWFWSDYFWSADFDANATEVPEPSIAGSLHFDARPKKDFRVFGKFLVNTPFTISPQIMYMGSYLKIPNIKIFELYSDFNYKDSVFFRVGKQTVNWGVGYFWSPADVISLESIDVNNPTADREGPLAFKMNIPFDIHNAYLYCIIPETITGITDIALAPKAEFVLGSSEVSIGGLYQHEKLLNAGLTATLPVKDFRFFGEAGVKVTGNLFDNSTKEAVLSGTVGGSYTNTDNKLAIMGQYYYDGKDENKTHQGAASLSLSEVFKSKLGLSLFWIGNLQDFSGTAKLGASWNFFDYLGLSSSLNFVYGDTTDTYPAAYMGSRFFADISLSLGSGMF